MSKFESFSDELKFSSSSVATAKRYDSAEDVEELIAAIKKDLKAVCFSGNTYSEEACASIAKALAECEDLEYADCSDMFTTRLKTAVPPALKLLCDAFEKTSIASLDVSDNALGGPGTACVVDLLSKNSFTTLRINNCGIGTAGALVLANTFRNLSGVESISLKDAKHEDLKEILEDDQTPAFTTESRCEIPLQVLVVGRNRLKVDGAEALSYGLCHLKNLKEFHAASNSIPPEGLIAICHSLQSCTELEVLDLNDNSLKAEGVPELVALLEKLPHLRRLNVGDCSLEAEGSLELLKALERVAPKLEFLDMTYNEIDNEGGEIIIRLLQSRENLSSLELNGSCFSSSTIKKLEKAMEEAGHPDGLGSMSDNEDEEDEEDEEEDDDEVDTLTSGVSKLSV